jgi:hypothetical protein
MGTPPSPGSTIIAYALLPATGYGGPLLPPTAQLADCWRGLFTQYAQEHRLNLHTTYFDTQFDPTLPGLYQLLKHLKTGTPQALLTPTTRHLTETAPLTGASPATIKRYLRTQLITLQPTGQVAYRTVRI